MKCSVAQLSRIKAADNKSPGPLSKISSGYAQESHRYYVPEYVQFFSYPPTKEGPQMTATHVLLISVVEARANLDLHANQSSTGSNALVPMILTIQ